MKQNEVLNFFKQSKLAYMKHQFKGEELVLVEYNEYLTKIFDPLILEAFTKPLNDEVQNSIYQDWAKLYLETIADKKIHILTSSFNFDRYYQIYVLTDISGDIITIINKMAQSYNEIWREEAIHQKIVTNVIDTLWITDKSLSLKVLASSHKTYYGEELQALDNELLNKRLSINNLIHELNTLINNKEKYFLKIIVDEVFKDGSINPIRYFFTKIYDENNNCIGLLVRTKNLSSRYKNQELLKSDKLMLETVLASASEGIYGVDILGEATFSNKACLEMLGYSSIDELLGKNMHALLHHHDDEGKLLEYKNSKIYKVLRTGVPSHREEKLVWRKDGTSFIAECYGRPLFSDNKVIGAIMTFYDISSHKKLLADLEESERSKSYLLSNLPGMAYRCRYDHEWTMLFVSEGVSDLLEYSPDELLYNRDLSYNDLIAPKYQDFVWRRYSEVLRVNEKFREEYQVITKSGKVKWVLELGRGVYREDGTIIAIEGIIIDISEQKDRQHEAEYLNKHDRLTGVYNRLYFDELINIYNKSEFYPLTYIVGDINGLRLINDAYGREFGNKQILKTIALIKEVVPENALFARTGGDEIALLIPNFSRDEAYTLYKKIIKRFEVYNLEKSSTSPNLSISFGFETNDYQEKDFSVIMSLADAYMKRRKLLERSSSHSSILNSIKLTMFERSQETEEHAERLNVLTHKLGSMQNIPQADLDLLSLFASFHDIGKVGISDDILKKPGKLTVAEWSEMKTHPEIGYRICLASQELSSIASLVLSHHERWDGLGYPKGLAGVEIPLLSRILSLVDAYDSMTNDRIYRPALSHEEAMEEIKRNRGTQFDPKLTDDFLELMKKLKKESFNE